MLRGRPVPPVARRPPGPHVFFHFWVFRGLPGRFARPRSLVRARRWWWAAGRSSAARRALR
eukprot:1972402-Alexandrium_andersonii.AAC.1